MNIWNIIYKRCIYKNIFIKQISLPPQKKTEGLHRHSERFSRTPHDYLLRISVPFKAQISTTLFLSFILLKALKKEYYPGRPGSHLMTVPLLLVESYSWHFSFSQICNRSGRLTLYYLTYGMPGLIPFLPLICTLSLYEGCGHFTLILGTEINQAYSNKL